MSKISKEKMIKEFIKKVKKQLPGWLKERKEHKEILDELEEHVWQKATELSGTGRPTLESVKKALTQIGTPQEIAKEYKKRGEPKIYITKEMWPLYIKVLGIILGLIIALNLLNLIIIYLTGQVNDSIIGNAVNNIQLGFLYGFTIVTIIFVILSMEGYFPEDFLSKKKRKNRRKAIELAAKEGRPVQPADFLTSEPFIYPASVIIGGSIGLIIGFLLVFNIFPSFIFTDTFLYFLEIVGLLLIGESILNILRGIFGNNYPERHQVIHVLLIIIKILWMLPFFYLLNSLHVSSFFTEIFMPPEIATELIDDFEVIIIIILIIIPLTIIEDIYKIVKLQKYIKLY